MNIDEIVVFSQKHFTDYVKTYSIVATTPIYGMEAPLNTRELTPGLWTFVIVSIVIGATLAGLTGLKSDASSLFTVVLFLFANWCAFSVWAFIFCRFLLRGTATFKGTLTTLLYLLAAVFVCSHFFAFLVNIVSTPIAEFMEEFDAEYVAPSIYVLVQAILLSIYLPSNLRSANNFGAARTFLLVIFVPIPILVINSAMSFVAILGFPGDFVINK